MQFPAVLARSYAFQPYFMTFMFCFGISRGNKKLEQNSDSARKFTCSQTLTSLTVMIITVSSVCTPPLLWLSCCQGLPSLFHSGALVASSGSHHLMWWSAMSEFQSDLLLPFLSCEAEKRLQCCIGEACSLACLASLLRAYGEAVWVADLQVGVGDH